MKVTAPTEFQAALIQRALDAERYSPKWKALWRGVYKQAQMTIKHHGLTWLDVELVEYWMTITPERESMNRIELDDLQCGFQTIAQESGAVVIPLDSYEEFGDTWEEEPEAGTEERLRDALDWREGLHPVTERAHLPKWCDGVSGPNPEAHLEPMRGFEALTCYIPR